MMTNEQLGAVWNALSWVHWLDARLIEDRVGFKKERTCERVREAVRILREQGYPIASGNDGYRKADEATVLAKCAQNFRSRAMGDLKMAGLLVDRITEGWTREAYEDMADRMLFGKEDDDAEEIT